ncbi:hypothetical protein M3Y99_00897100 [Aphelenchoides fujianensis]|nr:hypothetical protein M3Y99_00897100 [Aphelenchoides fujianensis]
MIRPTRTALVLLSFVVVASASPLPMVDGDTTADREAAAAASTTTELPTVAPRGDKNYLVLEEFRPLSPAFNQKDRAKIHAIKSRPVQKPQPVDVLVDFGDQFGDESPAFSASGARQLGRTSHFQLPTEKGPLVFDPMKHTTESHWLEWTHWGPCSNGERGRVRQCLEVNNVKCEGPSVETQKCFSFQNSDIPFAKDPLVIEREILGR